jgi:hypothetical protein
MSKQVISRQSSPEEKRRLGDAVYERLSEVFFDEITFLTAPGNTNSGESDITSTTTFNVSARIPDTSNGVYLSHNKPTRFRTNFYIGGAASDMAKADFYILLLATWTSTTAPSTDDIEAGLTSFMGIHSDAGRVSLISKGDKGGVVETETVATLTADNTYKIEFKFSGAELEAFIDDRSIGSIGCYYTRTTSDIVLYPFIIPIRSKDGTGVRFNMENYQLMQDK